MDDVTDETPTLPSAVTGVGGPLVAVGDALAGRYEVRAKLGRGATKEVYLAYDARLDREVALAIVVGSAGNDVAAVRARFEREAQVTGRLGDHPNIITAYDSGEIAGFPYLVLRAMRGGSLADRLERDRPSFADAIRLAGEIASALAHAHAHGVVHRDVKPDNVWLAADGTAALGDFGVAHQAGLERLTAEGIVVGTVRYLSPEQIRGEDIGPAGDLYALGVTLYELVTGRPPFIARDAGYVLTQHLTVAPEAPSRHEPAIPPRLERLILRLLAKQPVRRPASAALVCEELADMLPSVGSGGPAGGGAMQRASPARAVVNVQEPATTRRRLPDARRVVSVLAVAADVIDPEALHDVLDRCSGVVEHHGGGVERYLGDALVAIFGLTGSEGDDALRAARAAVELRDSASELRLGIETGEVFLRDGPHGRTVTGAPIGSAGRLADRAAGGQILVGDVTRSTLGDAVRVDGQSGVLLGLTAELPALLRASDMPFVGRAQELGALLDAFARVRDEHACRLVTVIGAPGIGKSRLAGEFLRALGESATVLAGSCVAYGEGTTYRALAEMLRGLGGEPRRRIEELLDGDEQAIRGLLGAVGLSDEPAQAEETSWALRRLLQRLTRDRPVVVAVEDIHWAEPALLDLLDHVVALDSGSPILLVCLTRPDLLESCPSWARAGPSRSLLRLDALTDDDARSLAEQLGARGRAERIAARAEGNPLFVEQLVAVDAGQDTSELPAGIQGVLAARIDRLDPDERALLRQASVEGRRFHAGVLASGRDGGDGGMSAVLTELARKGLVDTDRADFAGEEAFRFTHALIRDAAYAAIPKRKRAKLHADVAEWLEERPEAADEIVGYHFERACGLLVELDGPGERERAFAARAIDRFRAASHDSLARGNPAAASSLLERALTLTGSDEEAQGELLPTLGESLFESGRMADAARVLDRAIDGAHRETIRARARVERELMRLETETGLAAETSRQVADEVMEVLAREDDAHGQCRAWSLRAQVSWAVGRVAEADESWCRAAECARRAGDERELFNVLGWRAMAAVFGPTPVDAAIKRCEAFRAIVAASPVAVAHMVNPLALLHAMRCEFELADRCLRDAAETLRELGSLHGGVSHLEALVRLLAGQPQLAETPLRKDVDRLTSMSDVGLLATTTAILAQAVYARGDLDEAIELCRSTAASAPPDDIVTQVVWRGVEAKALVRTGDCERAEELAREAVALVEPTDLLSHRGDALVGLAEVLVACSKGREAEDVLRSGLELYERKGNLAGMARARRRGE